MSTLVVVITVIALSVMLVLQLRWNWHVFQYLYFLRIPLLAGFVLVFGWVPAVDDIRLAGDPFVVVTPGPYLRQLTDRSPPGGPEVPTTSSRSEHRPAGAPGSPDR